MNPKTNINKVNSDVHLLHERQYYKETVILSINPETSVLST